MKTANILRCQHWFSCKNNWKKCRNSILMTHHYSKLGSASEWIKQRIKQFFSQSKTLLRSGLSSEAPSELNFCKCSSYILWRTSGSIMKCWNLLYQAIYVRLTEDRTPLGVLGFLEQKAFFFKTE